MLENVYKWYKWLLGRVVSGQMSTEFADRLYKRLHLIEFKLNRLADGYPVTGDWYDEYQRLYEYFEGKGDDNF